MAGKIEIVEPPKFKLNINATEFVPKSKLYAKCTLIPITSRSPSVLNAETLKEDGTMMATENIIGAASFQYQVEDRFADLPLCVGQSPVNPIVHFSRSPVYYSTVEHECVQDLRAMKNYQIENVLQHMNMELVPQSAMQNVMDNPKKRRGNLVHSFKIFRAFRNWSQLSNCGTFLPDKVHCKDDNANADDSAGDGNDSNTSVNRDPILRYTMEELLALEPYPEEMCPVEK